MGPDVLSPYVGITTGSAVLHPTYTVRSIRSRPIGGVTKASACTLDGVMKFDGDESPHCVYNEAVGVRLAQTLHAPVADGVLTVSGDGQAFVSLHLAAPPDRLPNLHWKQRDKVAAKYPEEVAALVAFDIFIGNADRARNLKASIANAHLHLFRAFDHSHALLTIYSDNVAGSVAALASKHIIVERHPFYGLLDLDALNRWVGRIKATPEELIAECCLFRRDFRSVSQDLQRDLATALIARKKVLPAIVRGHTVALTTRQAKEEG